LAWWTRPAWRMLAADETLASVATQSVTREGFVMSVTKSSPGLLWRFALVTRSFLAPQGLPFADALPEERIAQAFADEELDFGRDDAEDVIDTPAVTLWGFLSQMLYAAEQRSCLAAVARVAVLWAALGKHVCASNSGAYCRGR